MSSLLALVPSACAHDGANIKPSGLIALHFYVHDQGASGADFIMTSFRRHGADLQSLIALTAACRPIWPHSSRGCCSDARRAVLSVLCGAQAKPCGGAPAWSNLARRDESAGRV